MDWISRESLLHWAERAERHARWSAYDLETLFDRAGLSLSETILKVGPGLARFAKGVVAHAS